MRDLRRGLLGQSSSCFAGTACCIERTFTLPACLNTMSRAAAASPKVSQGTEQLLVLISGQSAHLVRWGAICCTKPRVLSAPPWCDP